VAVILSRFPSVTETFILREVQEMERQGQPVRLVPLLREDPPVVHPEARPWVERALYTPFLSWSILASNLRTALRSPVRYGVLLAQLILASIHRPRFLAGTLAVFPKSVHLARLLDREGIQHVHAQFGTHPATAALVIATFSAADYSVTLHAHDLFVPRYRPFLGTKLRKAGFVRVISDFNRRTIASVFPRVPLDRVKVIHVGIEPEKYGDDSDLGERGSREAARATPGEILTVASLRDYKGIPVLVEACRILRDRGTMVHASVVGEGPMREELERLISRKDLETVVRLPGARTQQEVARLLARRPLFVLPSVILEDGWMEGIPVALMEAMAAQCPVVASELSGIPELIRDGKNGRLVEQGNPGALADAIQELLDNPELRHRFGKAGRETVLAEFDLRRCTRQLLDFMDEHNPGRKGVPDGVAETHAGRLGLETCHLGRDSQVHQILAPGRPAPHRFVAKRHLNRPGQSAPASHRARHEHQVLERLARPLKEGMVLSVPRPLGLQAEEGLLTMEVCTGEPLDQILRRARWRRGATWKQALLGMEQAGANLRDLQERTAGEASGPEEVAAWWEKVRADLARARPLLGEELHLQAQTLLDGAGQSGKPVADPNPADIVGRHGDYWPGNLLVDGERCTVLDFEGFGPGLWGEDPAYFLLQAGRFFDYPILKGRFPTLEGAFLRGYSRNGMEEDSTWPLFRLGALVQVLSHHDHGGGLKVRRTILALRSRVREIVR
jgi:glycosyltransferase involved in cell wall biosynthesis/aminoglycoside phosphotransferase (APT) family kinase protein